MQHHYHILWDNGQKSLCVQNLKAGYYRCTITDGLGCEFQYSFIVESLSGTHSENRVVKLTTYNDQNHPIILNPDNVDIQNYSIYDVVGKLI